jgi:DNA helicase IV
VLTDLLRDRDALRRFLPGLSDAEIDAVASEPDGLSPSDLPLLDALTGLLGGPHDVAVPRSPDEPFLAARAAADPGWTYGHVVVDEAQELSPMQWRMVRRRCPVGSITAVGDIDQTEAPHKDTTWEAALGDALGTRWRREDLTICYRTPREVMALTPPVLARAGSTNEPPRAVRSTGREPLEIDVAAAALVGRAAEVVASMRRRHPTGSVGVVTTDGWRASVTAAGVDVPVLTAREAKGLEWDACVVVDPDAIGAGPRGWNALYVALTRCTQDLALVRPC